jgi:flagella basal body P-ring formation protein FlgA
VNRQTLRMCLVAAGIAAFCLSGAAQTIRIKDRAEVAGSQVRLGEVATITGVSSEETEKFASVPVCLSPMPGISRDIESDYLIARARRHGVAVDDVNVEGAIRVRITSRADNILTPEYLALMLEQYIFDEMPWTRQEVEVKTFPMGRAINLPAGKMEVRIEHRPEYGFVGEGVFPASVFLDGQRIRSMYLKAHVEVYRPVVVAREPIRRGTPIRSGHLGMRTATLSTMNGQGFLKPEAAAGMIARRDISPGDMLTTDNVERPLLVKRREDVLLKYETSTIEIAMKVRARTEGRLGDVIAVENIASRKVLNAVVTGPGEVQLP